jgi:NADH:ubiquinone oxidoreductase subunit F (NADH-binding)
MTTPPLRRADPPVASRLFAAEGPGLREHLQRFGSLTLPSGEALIRAVDAASLRGRGGAGFPTGRKMASVTGRKPVVIGNGAEGEPLSRKEATLLARAPHLVLDGLHLAAAAVGADKVYLYLPSSMALTAWHALNERITAGLDERRVIVVEAPDTFIAGEESAVVRRIEGGRALPRDRVVPTSTSGVRARPTLVNNVETLAHVALIARYGEQWFRSIGDPAEPGTMLVTLSGTSSRRSVVELPTGTSLTGLLARNGFDGARDVHAVLLGGYHGSWIPASAIARVHLSRAGLAPFGATPGAGIVHVLPEHACGLARTADIVAYLAEQGARQCGPCRNGLPLLARLFEDLTYGRFDDFALVELERLLGLVDGRGACRHPDGTVRLARSALNAFAEDVSAHRAGRCEAALTGARRADRHDRQPDLDNA